MTLGSVVDAVERDLKALPTPLRTSALAASALVLAAEMDSADNSATSKSMCAGRLLETMDRLRELAPPQQEVDKVDELNARRTSRRTGSSAA